MLSIQNLKRVDTIRPSSIRPSEKGRGKDGEGGTIREKGGGVGSGGGEGKRKEGRK